MSVSYTDSTWQEMANFSDPENFYCKHVSVTCGSTIYYYIGLMHFHICVHEGSNLCAYVTLPDAVFHAD